MEQKTEINMNMKKNEQYHIDHLSKTIILTKKFLNEAGSLDNPEHDILMKLMEKHPNYTLVERKIKKAEGKKTYKGLSVKKMREFLEWLYSANTETQKQKLDEFDALVQFYEDFHKAEKASAMKTWFLKNHKEKYLDWEEAMKNKKPS